MHFITTSYLKNINTWDVFDKRIYKNRIYKHRKIFTSSSKQVYITKPKKLLIILLKENFIIALNLLRAFQNKSINFVDDLK